VPHTLPHTYGVPHTWSVWSVGYPHVECVECGVCGVWDTLHMCVAMCVALHVTLHTHCTHVECVECGIPSTHVECHTHAVCGVSHDSALHPPTPNDSFTCVTCPLHMCKLHMCNAQALCNMSTCSCMWSAHVTLASRVM